MSRRDVTIDQSWTHHRKVGERSLEAVPGLLHLFSNTGAKLFPIPLGPGGQVLGRDGVGGILIEDGCMSRLHAEISFDGTDWHIRDLDSRNGTFVDGDRLTAPRVTHDARILRIGDTIFGLMSDLRAFEYAVIEERDDVVVGPTLRQAWEEIESAAKEGRGLHLTGESGSGKELAAKHFHRSGPRSKGPFIAVNCAAIPVNLAERLLFGAKKGAYSGADVDVDGYVQAAHGGTLFLDEVAELDLMVQAKLLRVLETKDVMALGSSRARTVDITVCSATHRDLRAQVAAGKFRNDLLFRIASPAVALPALRDRIEDIPWLIQHALTKQGDLVPHVSLVESCLLRPWPGNVRELVSEIREAAGAAARAGSTRVQASHLGEHAGMSLDAGVDGDSPTPQRAGEGAAAAPPTDAAIVEALRKEGGNVSRAARHLGLHRTQLRRWIARNGEQIKSILDGGGTVAAAASADDTAPSAIADPAAKADAADGK